MEVTEKVEILEKNIQELKQEAKGLKEEVKGLKEEVKGLKEEVNGLKKELGSIEESEWKNNIVDDYMIKLVYPGIYCEYDKPTAGFPQNRRSISEKLYPGQYMFVYVTSPVKKIIGLTKVISRCKDNPGSRWPYYIDLEWVIKPRSGITFKDCGLDIRPRIGDTLYSINEDKAKEIINKLNEQKELDKNTLDYLANEYRDTYEKK